MELKIIEQKLNSVDGWKNLHGRGFFGFGGNDKKSLAIWNASTVKGIAPLYTLARASHESSYYAIYAFSTKGALSDAEIADLEATAREIPLGAIRYESSTQTYFQDMRSYCQTLDDNDGEHDQISISMTDEAKGLFVFVQADFKKEALDAPFVVYGLKDRCMHAYPIQKSKLEGI
ncbi:MAG: hypothetical protein LBK07_03385 [Tannerella sp.]|jgi:hypothetical protein|nr:hypothetical protein [Tannerella sp.]